MATATPQQSSIADYLVMLQNASEAVDALSRQIDVTEKRLSAEARAIAALDQAGQDQQQAIAGLEQEIARAEESLKKAQLTLNVVKGTPSEGETKTSIKEAKEHLTALRQEIAELSVNAEASHEHRIADRREREIRRVQLQEALSELHDQHEHLEREQARFYEQAGEQFYSQIEQELKEHDQQTLQAQMVLSTAEEARQHARASIAERLSLWPHLQLQAKYEMVEPTFEDAVTHLLQLKLAYINALVETAGTLRLAYPGRLLVNELGIFPQDIKALLLAPSEQSEQTLRRQRSAVQSMINARKGELAENRQRAWSSGKKQLAKLAR